VATSLFRRKPISQIVSESEAGHSRLARTLSAFDLTVIGIGAIIGAGIFARIGSAANAAGPAVILSLVLSAVGCACAGLCYAEMAAMIPVAGSAYTYAFATLGELFAWLIGWSLILEYAVGAITVAIYWSGYLVEFLNSFGIHLPHSLTHGVMAGGIINLPAVLLVVLVTALLIRGVKESARATAIIVIIKVAVVLAVLALGIGHVKPVNWTPFLPKGGWGIVQGAGVIFFAYIGFDAVTTMSEEAKNTQRDLPIGILASLAICTLLYVAVAAVMTGMVPYTQLVGEAPVAQALRGAGITAATQIVTIGILAGLASVVLVMMMGQPRVFLAMARDGLLPGWISAVHPTYHTPARATLITGTIVGICAATLSPDIAGDLTSMGTLFAFVLVCLGVVMLRRMEPSLPRPFRTPLVPVVPLLGVGVCLVMMLGLDKTRIPFLVWSGLGLIVYLAYSRSHSRLAKSA